MPNTYSQIYIQVVFTVKGREHFIKEEYRERLQQFMSGIISEKKQKVMAIYCMPDHVHIFMSISPDISVSDITRDVKSNATAFLKNEKMVSSTFSWQQGFGAFSYAKSQSAAVVNYILNQKEHHRKRTFREEYLDFLEKFGVDYDEKYLFEFYE